jgi:hypothetical protein
MQLPLTNLNTSNQVIYMVGHEFAHALGQVHEHQSPNSKIPWNLDTLYREYGARGWTKEVIDANIINPYSPYEVEAGAYDRYSWTHYPVPARFTLDGIERGSTGRPSQEDIKLLRSLYGEPPQVPNVPAQQAPRRVFLPIIRK